MSSMENMDEKLNSFLNDPNAMRTVMEFAKQLSGRETPPQEESPKQPTGDFDPAMITKIMPLLQALKGEESDAVKLLFALQPYLSDKKRDKVSRAVKLAHLIHVGKKFIAEGGWELV